MITENNAIDHLLLELQSPDPRTRSGALIEIGCRQIHRGTRAAIKALQDHDAEVRSWAAWALDNLKSPEALPALVEAIQDDSMDVRSNAGWALVHLGPRVVPDVITVLRDTHHDGARNMAFQVLLRVGGPDARNAIHTYWR